jgi:phage terminase small subunit
LNLTKKQQEFVQAKLCGATTEEAAKKAGYASTMSAYNSCLGSEIVRKELERRQKIHADRLEVTADKVLGELAMAGFSDPIDLFDCTDGTPKLLPIHLIPEYARRAIASIKVRRRFEGPKDEKVPVDIIEYKLWDKIAALKSLGSNLGLFPKANEIHNQFLQVNMTDDERIDRLRELAERVRERRLEASNSRGTETIRVVDSTQASMETLPRPTDDGIREQSG